jgi:DNA invertase Pin-like site-specific DNA recombinase
VAAQEYVDVETDKQSGRVAFGNMVSVLKARPTVHVLLVEKTDRLYHNLKDWVTVDGKTVCPSPIEVARPTLRE